MHTEKRTNPVTVRFEDSLFIKLSKLAHTEERELADYIHHEISLLVNGHATKLPHCQDSDNQTNRNQ